MSIYKWYVDIIFILLGFLLDWYVNINILYQYRLFDISHVNMSMIYQYINGMSI